jgi:hypothetical protein
MLVSGGDENSQANVAAATAMLGTLDLEPLGPCLQPGTRSVVYNFIGCGGEAGLTDLLVVTAGVVSSPLEADQRWFLRLYRRAS